MSAPVFIPNPNLRYVGTIDDYPRAAFMPLPAHPAQRATELHAINLAGSGVLDVPLDQHREVGIVMIGDAATSVDDMIAAYANHRDAALAKYGHVLNGHTRRYLWGLANGLAAPDLLRATVYAATDKEAAIMAYKAVDSIVSVKGRKDTMQSTLRVAGLVPESDWMKRAGQLAPALDLAIAVLCGGRHHKLAHMRAVLRHEIGERAHIDPKMYTLLPHLAQVDYFRDPLLEFDGLDLSARDLPLGAPFVAGYLSIMLRDPEQGLQFIEKLRGEPGAYAGGLMDAFYCIRKIDDVVNDAKAKLSTTAAERTDKLLATVLNAYEGWRSEADSFKADKYPTEAGIIGRFNPVLAKAVQALTKAAEREAVKRKEKRLAELSQRVKTRRKQTAEAEKADRYFREQEERIGTEGRS